MTLSTTGGMLTSISTARRSMSGTGRILASTVATLHCGTSGSMLRRVVKGTGTVSLAKCDTRGITLFGTTLTGTRTIVTGRRLSICRRPVISTTILSLRGTVGTLGSRGSGTSGPSSPSGPSGPSGPKDKGKSNTAKSSGGGKSNSSNGRRTAATNGRGNKGAIDKAGKGTAGANSIAPVVPTTTNIVLSVTTVIIMLGGEGEWWGEVGG